LAPFLAIVQQISSVFHPKFKKRKPTNPPLTATCHLCFPALSWREKVGEVKNPRCGYTYFNSFALFHWTDLSKIFTSAFSFRLQTKRLHPQCFRG
jgi:hypothetical protein